MITYRTDTKGGEYEKMNKKFKIYYSGVQKKTTIEYAGKKHQFKFLEGVVVNEELASYLSKTRKDFSIVKEMN